MSKSIVIFFSHAGDNYSVGNIEVGNTKIVADYISEITGADQFEIVTHKYDGMAYMPLIELAKEEAKKGGAFVRRQFAILRLFLGQFDERHIGHAIVFVGGDFKLLSAGDFADVVGHDFRVSDLDVAHVVVVACVGEEDDDGFVHVALILRFDFLFVLCVAAGDHEESQ